MSNPHDPPGSGQCNPNLEILLMCSFAGLDWGSTGPAVCMLDEKVPSSCA
jgi:hypothetical protein